MSENQRKKQVMSAAERKGNQRGKNGANEWWWKKWVPCEWKYAKIRIKKETGKMNEEDFVK